MCSPCVSFALLLCFRHSVAPNVRMLCQRCKVRNLNQRPCQNRDANQHGRHTSICATRPVLNAVMVVYLLQRLLQRPVSHHVGGPGSSGTEQLESRHQNTHGENEDGRTHPHLHLFLGGTPCSDGHACNVDDQQRGYNETHGTVELGKGSDIRSYGEDTRVAHVVGIAQRTCANGPRYHEESEWSLITSLMCPFCLQ